MSFYRRQARQGNLQILCARCNSLKGNLRQTDWEALVRTLRFEKVLPTSEGSTTQNQRIEIDTVLEPVNSVNKVASRFPPGGTEGKDRE